MKTERIRILKPGTYQNGPVIYWMSRDQRAKDNWALLYAQQKALTLKTPLFVVFTLTPKFLDATLRQYDFMLKGLQQVQSDLQDKNIPFYLIKGDPAKTVPQMIKDQKAGLLVCDFDPLRIKQAGKKKILSMISIPVHEVDAHNIVPCWIASNKQEFGAYTLRPKIHKILDQYLDKYSTLKKHTYNDLSFPKLIDPDTIIKKLNINHKVKPIDKIISGEKAAQRTLKKFLKNRMNNFATERNDPNRNGQSNLSPYLHFGQISAQRVAMETIHSDQDQDNQDAFLEELIIRRELSDNFCFYNPGYDHFEGFPEWAKRTHLIHRSDTRPYSYTLKQLEKAQTHDDLWNAAQRQMILDGKMHGYMRMYWAKKILEWTKNPEEALEYAIYLNDKYQLDGRDPNGYAGIAWSIGGTHDRAWGERSVFGKIRYMNYNGCKSKFDVTEYINKYNES